MEVHPVTIGQPTLRPAVDAFCPAKASVGHATNVPFRTLGATGKDLAAMQCARNNPLILRVYVACRCATCAGSAPLTDVRYRHMGVTYPLVFGGNLPHSLLCGAHFGAAIRHKTRYGARAKERGLRPIGGKEKNSDAPAQVSHLRRTVASRDRDQRPIGESDAGSSAYEQGDACRTAGDRRPDQRGAAPQQRTPTTGVAI